MTSEFPLICEVAHSLIAKGEAVHLVIHDRELGEISGFAFTQNPAFHAKVVVHFVDNLDPHLGHLSVDQLETNSTLKKVGGRWLLKTS